MSFQSPIVLGQGPLGGSLEAAVPTDNLRALERWSLLVDASLKLVRNALAVKLDGVDRGEIHAPRAKLEALLDECDAIGASAAALVAPLPPAQPSFLGHLVSELEAAVAHAERESRIAALEAHKARLEELMRILDADGPGEKASL
jgi:arachidonate 15-lipoxygenase